MSDATNYAVDVLNLARWQVWGLLEELDQQFIKWEGSVGTEEDKAPYERKMRELDEAIAYLKKQGRDT